MSAQFSCLAYALGFGTARSISGSQFLVELSLSMMYKARIASKITAWEIYSNYSKKSTKHVPHCIEIQGNGYQKGFVWTEATKKENKTGGELGGGGDLVFGS